jgi:hypothetical protein
MSIFAQGDVPSIDFSQKTIVKEGESGGIESKKVPDVEYKHAINIDITGSLGGYLAVNYEQVIRKNLSVEVGAGITFVSLTGSWANDIFGQNNTNQDDAIDFWKQKNMQMVTTAPFPANFRGVGSKASVQQKTGFYVMAEPRFFPEDAPFNGFFIGLRLQNQFNTLLFNQPTDGNLNAYLAPSIEAQFPMEVAENQFDAIPQCGWEWQRNHLLIGLEGGVGARILGHYNTYSVGENKQTGLQSLRKGGTQSDVLPIFNLVFRMGYEF